MIKYQKILVELALIFLSLIIGFSFAAYLVQPMVVHPSDLNNLSGDSVQHFIGWAFYRSDNWSFPITLSTSLMYPYGTSIALTDSFPIISIILKSISPLIPELFDWHGIVAIINCSLMFYSGIYIFRQLRGSLALGILAGGILLCSAPFIWRFFGHFALTSQWLIVLNIYLIAKPNFSLKKDVIWQCIIIAIAAATHPYIVVMNMFFSTALLYKIYSKLPQIFVKKYTFKFNKWYRLKIVNGLLILIIISSFVLSFTVFIFTAYVQVELSPTSIKNSQPVENIYYQMHYTDKPILLSLTTDEISRKDTYNIKNINLISSTNKVIFSKQINKLTSLYDVLKSGQIKLINVSYVRPEVNGGYSITMYKICIFLLTSIILIVLGIVVLFAVLFILEKCLFEVIITPQASFQGTNAFGKREFIIKRICENTDHKNFKYRLSYNKCYALRLQAMFVLEVLVLGYLLGWFSNNTDPGRPGFGVFSANFFSLINPQYGSFILKQIPVPSRQYEGFAYLGFGVIISAIFILIVNFNKIKQLVLFKYLRGFYVVLGILFLLALSNKVRIANYEINLPYGGDEFNIFACSGRFIWPLYYSIVLLVILQIYDFFKNKKVALFVLLGILFLQFFDNRYLIDLVRGYANRSAGSNNWKYGLSSPNWFKLQQFQYKHIVLIEDQPDDKTWIDNNGYLILYKFALIAIVNHTTINDAYLSRRSMLVDDGIKQTWVRVLSGEALEPQTLYIIKDSRFNNKINNCSKLDGYNVCATNIEDFIKDIQPI